MSTEVTRNVIEQFFAKGRAGDAPEAIASLFSDDADWQIPGSVEHAPWVAPRKGRAGVADFVRDLRRSLEPIRFDVHSIVVEGDRGVAVGELSSRIKSTGKTFDSEFAIAVVVRDGLIVRYRMFEDSYGLVLACGGSAAPPGAPS